MSMIASINTVAAKHSELLSRTGEGRARIGRIDAAMTGFATETLPSLLRAVKTTLEGARYAASTLSDARVRFKLDEATGEGLSVGWTWGHAIFERDPETGLFTLHALEFQLTGKEVYAGELHSRLESYLTRADVGFRSLSRDHDKFTAAV